MTIPAAPVRLVFSITRLLKPSWFVLLMLIAFTGQGTAAADVPDAGAAWVTKDFIASDHNDVIGTEVTTEMKRFYVDPVADPRESEWITIWQEVELESHQHGVIMGGFYNKVRTYRGTMRNTVMSYMRVESPGMMFTLPSGSSQGMQVRKDVTRDRRLLWMALRMSYKEACRSTNPGQYPCTFLPTWELAYDRSNPYIKIVLTIPGGPSSDMRPRRIVNARHGYYTKNAWRENDIYIEMSDHKYYVRPSCQQSCSQLFTANWPSTSPFILPWGQPQTESPQSPEVMVWPAMDGATGALTYGFCSGLAPETPCGCIECGAPAFLPNQRVYPDTTEAYDNWTIMWPLDWTVNNSTFASGQGLKWSNQTREAASEWDAALGFGMFRTYPGGVSQEIVVNGQTTVWTDPGIARSNLTMSQLKDYEGCLAGQSGGRQYQNRLGPPHGLATEIWIDLYDYDWTDTMVYTSLDFTPRGSIPMRAAIAHEYGHVAGLEHGTGGSVWPNNAMGLIELYGHDHEEVSINYAEDLVRAANCLVYRGRQ